MPPRDADNRQGPAVVLLVCGDVAVASWALPEARRADLSLIDDLARLQLSARRLGCSIRLQHVDPLLWDLLILSGLADIVAPNGVQ
jgi:hypothetical protein